MVARFEQPEITRMGGYSTNMKSTVHRDIQRKIKLLQEYLEAFLPYVALDAPAFQNFEKQATMERLFMLMVDEAIDINAALAYQLGGKIAESNRSTFLELVPVGIIDEPFAIRIGESVKIRNQLAHDYEKLQKSAAVEAMKKFAEPYKEYTALLISKFIPK